MLERAAGCLENGGRRLFNLPKQLYRTRRSLHSAFWCHGAGDIDLPTWWISLLQRPPPERTRSPQSIVDTAKTCLAAGLADGGFLDFLYPAKTLSLIHKLAVRDAAYLRSRTRQSIPRASRNYTSEASDGRVALESDRDHAVELVTAIQRHHTRDNHRSNSTHEDEQTDLDDGEYGVLDFTDIDSAVQGWTVEDYAKGIQIASSRGNTENVLLLYRKALSQFKDHKATPAILRLAIGSEDWNIGVDAWLAYRETVQEESYFWDGLNVFDMTTLIHKVIKLQKGYQAATAQFGVNSQLHFRDFAVKIIENILSRERFPDSNLSTWAHYKLFTALKIFLRKPSERHYYLAIMQVLSTKYSNLAQAMDYGDHAIRLYLLMRQGADFIPNERMLLRLFRRARRTHHHMVQTIFEDLKTYYGPPSKEVYWYRLFELRHWRDIKAMYILLEEMQSTLGTNLDSPAIVRMLLEAHSRRGQLPDALRLFEILKSCSTSSPQIKDWNLLVGAYCRAGNLDGAKICLAEMIKNGIEPNVYTHSPLMAFHAHRGDTEALLNSAKSLLSEGDSAHAVYIGCQVDACIQNKDFDKAKALLYESIDKELLGNRTKMWNSLLSAYAARGDLDDFNEVRNRMLDAGIREDAITFAAQVTAMCSKGYTEEAFKFTAKLPYTRGLRPSVNHFIVLANGFLRQKKYGMVSVIYNWMLDHGVAPDLTFKAMMIKAAAKIDQLGHKKSQSSQLLVSRAEDLVDEVLESLEPMTLDDQERPKGPSLRTFDGPDTSNFFEYLIAMYGDNQAFDKAAQLYDRYITLASSLNPGEPVSPPTRMLCALMINFRNSKQYDKVERCWQLALTKSTPLGCPKGADTSQPGWVLPSRRYILSLPLFYYMRALIEEGRLDAIDSLFRYLLRQGWGIKSQAWNLYVQSMAFSQHHLRAFRTAEIQLMNEWPGWPVYGGSPSRFIEAIEKLQPSLVASELRMPSYKTMILLAASYRDIRSRAMLSRIGTEKFEELKELAPRVLAAVTSMPRTDDALQKKYLGRD